MLQEYDVRDLSKVKEAVKYSDVVFNLVGRDYPTRYALAVLFGGMPLQHYFVFRLLPALYCGSCETQGR